MTVVSEYSLRHPHEPEIPPALDAEGRCLVCLLQVQRDEALTLLRELRDAGIAVRGPSAGQRQAERWQAASNRAYYMTGGE